VSTPTDRLPYADCAYIEAKLRNGETAGRDSAPAGADASAADADVRCPLCHRDRHGPTMSVEALDVLQFRFWSDDHRRFDHIGFARAVMAACAAE
jgi:hypothetical protein